MLYQDILLFYNNHFAFQWFNGAVTLFLTLSLQFRLSLLHSLLTSEMQYSFESQWKCWSVHQDCPPPVLCLEKVSKSIFGSWVFYFVLEVGSAPFLLSHFELLQQLVRIYRGQRKKPQGTHCHAFCWIPRSLLTSSFQILVFWCLFPVFYN